MKVVCQNVPRCRIPVGSRHLETCPRHGASSGPSGKGLQPRSNVDATKLDRLRELLGTKEATPNEVLEGAIERLRTCVDKPRKVHTVLSAVVTCDLTQDEADEAEQFADELDGKEANET